MHASWSSLSAGRVRGRRTQDMPKSVATVPVVVKSPTDETMVLSISIGDIIEDKIQQFIIEHQLGNEIFGPIYKHVKSLLSQEEDVKAKSPKAYSKKIPSSSYNESPKSPSNSAGSYASNYHSPIVYRSPSIHQFPTDDEEVYVYNRARNQQQDDWSPIQQIQPTYNELNVSSNNSLVGRCSRSGSIGGNGSNKPRARSLSPSSLNGSRKKRNDAFQRLYEDAEKSQRRKEDMGFRLDEEMWRGIRDSSYRKSLIKSPTRHFRFDADRERVFQRSGLSRGEFIYQDHQRWMENREVKLAALRQKLEAKRQEEEEKSLQKVPTLSTSFAMQMPSAMNIDAVVDRLHNSHFFYQTNRAARAEQYRNQYNEMVAYNIPSINPRSRKLADKRIAAKKAAQQQQADESQGQPQKLLDYCAYDLNEPAQNACQQVNRGFFTLLPQGQQQSNRNAPSTVTHTSNSFPSQLNSADTPLYQCHQDVWDNAVLPANETDAFEMSLRLQDLQYHEDPAAANMEHIAGQHDNTNGNNCKTHVVHKSRDGLPLKINTEAPMLQASSVLSHVAHTPMHILPQTSSSSTTGATTDLQQQGHLRTFSHSSLGSGAHYDTKHIQDIRLTSPFLFRGSVMSTPVSILSPTRPLSSSSKYFVAGGATSISGNNSMVSSNHWSRPSPFLQLQNEPLTTASVVSNLTAMRLSQQPTSRFYHYAQHAPLLEVHERLYKVHEEQKTLKSSLHSKYTPQFSFTPKVGRPPKSPIESPRSKAHTQTKNIGNNFGNNNDNNNLNQNIVGYDTNYKDSNNNNDNNYDGGKLDLMALATVSKKKNVFQRLYDPDRLGQSSTNSSVNMDTHVPIPRGVEVAIGNTPQAPLVRKLLTNELSQVEIHHVTERLHGYSKKQQDQMDLQKRLNEENWRKRTKVPSLSIPKSEKIVREKQRASLKEIFLVLCMSVEYQRDLRQKQQPRVKRENNNNNHNSENRGNSLTEENETEIEVEELDVASDSLDIQAISSTKVQPNVEVVGIDAGEVAETKSDKNDNNMDIESSENMERARQGNRLYIFLADPSHLKHKELIEAMFYTLATFQKEFLAFMKRHKHQPRDRQIASEEEKHADNDVHNDETFPLLYVTEDRFVSRVFELLQAKVFIPVVASLLSAPPRNKSPVSNNTAKSVLVSEKKTNQLTQQRYRDRFEGRISVEDSLLAYREHYNQKLEDLRKVVEAEETKELTFTPALISSYERERHSHGRRARSLSADSRKHAQKYPYHYLPGPEKESVPPLHYPHKQVVPDYTTEYDDRVDHRDMKEHRQFSLSELASNRTQPRHRWTSTHIQPPLPPPPPQEQQRTEIEKSPSFLSSPKFRSMYRALSSKNLSQQQPSQLPPRPMQSRDPADSSPFRFPPEVFGRDELPGGRSIRRNTQEARKRSYSAGSSFR